MIETTFRYSNIIQNDRTIRDVMIYTMSEIGELAEEVNIATGFSSKQMGKDGIVGEAVDAIICLLDLIKQYEPNITEEQVMMVVNKKLDKWRKKYDNS